MPTQTIDEVRQAGPRKQPYTLYAAKGRLYARNAAGPVIDLGPLERDGSHWSWQLDGSQLRDHGFADERSALRDVARHLRFLWLDGQFTALPDVRQSAGVDFGSAAQLDIELDEVAPGEPVTDARV
jgi:hypothetical protein